MPPTSVNETALYRHFDKNGRLLYVGISLSAVMRMQQHMRQAKWARDIARIDVEWFDTRYEAERAEWQAIRRERPIHNQTFNRAKPAPTERIVVIGEDNQPLSDTFEFKPFVKVKQKRKRLYLNKEQLARQREANVKARAKARQMEYDLVLSS